MAVAVMPAVVIAVMRVTVAMTMEVLVEAVGGVGKVGGVSGGSGSGNVEEQ
jgi:hypothetical protein